MRDNRELFERHANLRYVATDHFNGPMKVMTESEFAAALAERETHERFCAKYKDPTYGPCAYPSPDIACTCKPTVVESHTHERIEEGEVYGNDGPPEGWEPSTQPEGEK